MPDAPHGTRLNPIVAFLIGLSIVLLASILNAAGLNLTKLDHVRTSSIPKSARSKDWMRPLWLLGMLLYILSQLLGSTLALEYMRAEYVAPLGATSLVFNFLFARFLVGTPVTSTDIYGTIVVILGVIGIVAFGSINSGLASETDVAHLTYLWRRPGWLGFFFFMTGALLVLLVVVSCLDAVLVSRNDLSAIPSPNPSITSPPPSRVQLGNSDPTLPSNSDRNVKWWQYLINLIRGIGSAIRQMIRAWNVLMIWITSLLEIWTSAHDDKQIAWTLGIGWSCCGGGLAGACLVFAKATVKLLTGSLSKQNPGNQFGHVSSIFTIIFLASTAVLQIICLNRGLRVYDSTLVVPVFYGVYTATGFLDSLIFNDEVDAYQSWTLFLIFASILVLISGVVLLTHKKPEPTTTITTNLSAPLARHLNKNRNARKPDDEESSNALQSGNDENVTLWAIGDDDEDGTYLHEDDEDIDHHQNPANTPLGRTDQQLQSAGKGKAKDGNGSKTKVTGRSWRSGSHNEEGARLISGAHDDEENDDEDEAYEHSDQLDISKGNGQLPRSTSTSGNSTSSWSSGKPIDEDDFGEWEDARTLSDSR